MRDVFLSFCHQAHIAARLEAGSGLTPGLDRARPADVLVRDWAQGKPAAFDITVTSPLTPAILALRVTYSIIPAADPGFRWGGGGGGGGGAVGLCRPDTKSGKGGGGGGVLSVSGPKRRAGGGGGGLLSAIYDLCCRFLAQYEEREEGGGGGMIAYRGARI